MIYLAVSWYTFVHFILHIHLIFHLCVPRLEFLEPKWSQTFITNMIIIYIVRYTYFFNLSTVPSALYSSLAHSVAFQVEHYSVANHCISVLMPDYQISMNHFFAPECDCQQITDLSRIN